MREILFGKLKKGGNATLSLKPNSNELTLDVSARPRKPKTGNK